MSKKSVRRANLRADAEKLKANLAAPESEVPLADLKKILGDVRSLNHDFAIEEAMAESFPEAEEPAPPPPAKSAKPSQSASTSNSRTR